MKFSLFLALSGFLWAQEPLTLREAVRVALRKNHAVAGAEAAVRATETHVQQARAGILPKVEVSESFTRGNNPVYVFGSLLTQHQFEPANFEIGRLNRPDALNNLQSQVTLEQPLYDGGQTRRAVRAANLGGEATAEEQRRAQMDVTAQVARAYFAAVLAGEQRKSAEQAVRSAEADLERAERVRAAGLSTDADVLSIRVHLAAVNEQKIARAADLEVARAALNDAMGLPLDTPHELSGLLTALDLPDLSLEAVEKEGASRRPETRGMALATEIARVQAENAHASRLPQVSFRGVLETDAQRFVKRGGVNWLAAISVRWNLFNGFADKARISEAGYLVKRAEAEKERTESAVRLQVRRAYAALSAAQQRIEVAKAAVAEAEESLRITQNRYQAGMNNVTDLLRTETAMLETRTRYMAAIHDQRVAATMLEYAAGRLSADSEVLN